MSVRPFSPNESFSFPKPPALHNKRFSQEPSNAPERSSSAMSEVKNPFGDDASIDRPSTMSSQLTQGAMETVCRPFMPTLADEISVRPGDVVCIVHAYDDGWAYVSKQSDKTKGLIPIDCFREDQEDIPAFLASKRVSSFYGTAV
ncbi:hypothetical protein DENSPDRAFT_770897 [Dentipellis sp. KUC8613]|nr:hypothetical protein DENSPDRAFT_770897 [Dentipellis sp. KUC8613]